MAAIFGGHDAFWEWDFHADVTQWNIDNWGTSDVWLQDKPKTLIQTVKLPELKFIIIIMCLLYLTWSLKCLQLCMRVCACAGHVTGTGIIKWLWVSGLPVWWIDLSDGLMNTCVSDDYSLLCLSVLCFAFMFIVFVGVLSLKLCTKINF